MPTSPSLDAKYHLQPDIPEGWKPDEVVVATMTYDVDGNHRLNFQLSDVAYYPGADVDEVIALLLRGSLPSGEHRVPQVAAQSPLEIWIYHRCWVLVALDPNRPWRFRAGGPAITSKERYGHKSCQLRQTDSNGKEMNPDLPGPDGRLAYFAICYRDKGEPGQRQRFTFHLDVEQDQGRGWLEIGIDPDVPDDGGGVPFI
jgi:hypothetical protein